MHVHRGWRLYHGCLGTLPWDRYWYFRSAACGSLMRRPPATSPVDDSVLVMEQNLISETLELRQSTGVCFWCEQQLIASCFNQWEVGTGSSDGLSSIQCVPDVTVDISHQGFTPGSDSAGWDWNPMSAAPVSSPVEFCAVRQASLGDQLGSATSSCAASCDFHA